ncbi:hypothetical protein LOTGIDRAFT_127250 [Lottia gigantea]|uniref:G-protein coupled receptors family 1 profile domain-containing protein n=1 Tax=Lottia gigantea TaxID=225164 RepID=V3ZYM6_LOTGI|nr:hypothetical protein LOTGIDRAFT_127250 [Lottia gigantea]ESO87745.1 hypothetical protein LOTGIDRAFT_127250 [Lottia gigantea]
MKVYVNFSQDFDETEFDILRDKRWQIGIIILYVIVIVFGFIGNLLVVIVIGRYKQLHTVTNIFIVNLALADIALCLFNLPFQLHYQIKDYWSFGRVLCHVINPTFGVPVFVSSLSILAIAVDRFILIVYPFKPRMTNFQAMVLVVIITVVTIVLAIPLMVFTELDVINEPAIQLFKVYCVEKWHIRSKRIYAVTVFILQFVIPLILTTIFYSLICIVLKNRPIKKHETRRNRRTNKILISVVLTFTLCWLPWNIFSLFTEFVPNGIPIKYFRLTDLLIKIFAMSSACINPFLYGWLNDSFRKEFGKLLFSGWKKVNHNGHEFSRTTGFNNTMELGTPIKRRLCSDDEE